MALTVNLTVTQLAGAIELGDGTTALEEPDLSKLTRMLASATADVEEHIDGRIIEGKTIPSAVIETAIIQICAYQWDKPNSPSGSRFSNYFTNSGAKATLGKYLYKSAGV